MRSRRERHWERHWLGIVAVIAVMSEACGIFSPPAKAGEPCKSVADLLSAASSDTPPLPPREVATTPSVPATPSGQATTTVFQMVVQTTPQSLQQVPDHGWQAGRVHINELTGGDEVEPAVATDGTEGALQPQICRSAATSTVVEPQVTEESNTLLTSAVLPSEIVFDGIAVLANSLPPIPAAPLETDESSLLTVALAPRPLDASSASALVDPTPTPVDVSNGPAAPTDAGAAVAQSAPDATPVDSLHKPLAAVTLTTGLFAREPPDQSATKLPSHAPVTIWGGPWPSTSLARYRYSVPFHYRPLYFEQPNLERCGVSYGLFSPYVSAANFAGNVVLLPLHMLLDPPCTCVPTLGDCTACQKFGLCPHCNLQ
ncbi:MAG: hypothetical protein ACK5Q5_18140 [Planctomycetaceae bacterium]